MFGLARLGLSARHTVLVTLRRAAGLCVALALSLPGAEPSAGQLFKEGRKA
jgi:hypothetical protein